MEPEQKSWRCQDCTDEEEVFSSEEDLIEHRLDMIWDGEMDHAHCHKCMMPFRTVDGLEQHYWEVHPPKLGWTCPECGEKFDRLHMIVRHVEETGCGKARPSQTEKDEKENGAPPGGQPDCLTEENLKAFLEQQDQSCVGQRTEQSPPAEQALSKPALSSTQEVAPAKKAEGDEWFHPDQPGFDVQSYWNKYSRRFVCPYKMCGKSFPSDKGLARHLKSPAHTDEDIQWCPACFGRFSTTAALAQHAESPTRRCRLRHTKWRRQFLIQLAAGIVLVEGQPPGGTLKSAAAEFDWLSVWVPKTVEISGAINKADYNRYYRERSSTAWEQDLPEWYE